ncbi:MAG TPA: Smr/MutS family protein [Polyangiaceae bacterium]
MDLAPSGRSPEPRREQAERPLTFARAAAASGVTPLKAERRRVPPPQPAPVPPPRNARPDFVLESADDWLEGYQRSAGARVVARLRGTPVATLDLHGADVASARRRLFAFLAAQRGPVSRLVLVIVGKGRHSPGGRAVLRQEIGEWLSSGPAAGRVLAFRSAPPALGGSGGVLVLLKSER